MKLLQESKELRLSLKETPIMGISRSKKNCKRRQSKNNFKGKGERGERFISETRKIS